MLTGNPMDWDLQLQVARIPGEVWETGADTVAKAVAQIEAMFLASLYAERVELTGAGRLTLVPQPMLEGRLLADLLASVEDTLALASEGRRNELPADSYQARLIGQTLERYGNDPQRIEQNFERARVSLLQDMADDVLPTSAANRDLVQTLADACNVIRDSDPDISEARTRVRRLRISEINETDAARVAAVAEEVAAVSEAPFVEELRDANMRLPGVRRDDPVPDSVLPIGASPRNAGIEASDARLRQFSRLSKVWLYLKSFDRAELSRLMHLPEVQLVALIGSLASIIGLLLI